MKYEHNPVVEDTRKLDSDNYYTLDWFELLTYRGDKIVVYGFGHHYQHMMNWSGCNFWHGRMCTQPFNTTGEALDWIHEKVSCGEITKGMQLPGHFHGDNDCVRGCSERLIEDIPLSLSTGKWPKKELKRLKELYRVANEKTYYVYARELRKDALRQIPQFVMTIEAENINQAIQGFTIDRRAAGVVMHHNLVKWRGSRCEKVAKVVGYEYIISDDRVIGWGKEVNKEMRKRYTLEKGLQEV